MARTVQCVKLNKEAEGLDFPPYPGELGKKIYETVSKEAWAAWLKHQTILVNENRLNLADQRARKYLAQQMEKHFFGDGADAGLGSYPVGYDPGLAGGLPIKTSTSSRLRRCPAGTHWPRARRTIPPRSRRRSG